MVPDGTSQMYFDHNLRLIQTPFISITIGLLITILLLIPEEKIIMASKTQLLPEINSDYLSFNCQDSVKESFLHTKDVLLPMMKVKPNVNNNKKIFSVFVPIGLLIHSSRNNSIS
jgi:hypothetical protein